MQRTPLLCILFAALQACAQSEKPTEYPLQVGDISFDTAVDEAEFKPCDESRVAQYYNFGKGLQYKGEKIKIIEHFKNQFKADDQNDESGFITIRFIVNCQGKTGRFRMEAMDPEYNEKAFSENITTQLWTLTKQLDGWIVAQYDGKTYDYYQYLTFKIENGQLTEIMP